MTFYSERCDIEFSGNLLVAHSVNNQCNNFFFTPGHPDGTIEVPFSFQEGVFGYLSKAPRWMQRSGLEWAYRLLQEPGRLGRRYLVYNPRFVWLVLRHQLLFRRV